MFNDNIKIKDNDYIKKKKFFLFNYLFQLKNKYLLINKKIHNYNIIILYNIGIIFYIFSLTNINGVDMRCFKWKGVQCYYSLAILTLISSIFISISIYKIIFYKYNKINLLLIFIIYLFLYLIDHNDGIQKHGFFNFIGLIFASLFIFCLLCCIKFLNYLYFNGKRYIIFIISILIFISYIFLRIYETNNFNCDYWIKGLNNSFIDNLSKNYPCNINIPKPHSCYLSQIGPFFDFSAKYKPSCLDEKILKNEKNIFLKTYDKLNFSNISKNNHFGFPLTNNDDINPYEYGILCYPGTKSFQEYVNSNVILMDLYNENKTKYYPNKPKPEIEVYFKGDYGKLIINTFD